jgi:hypothetical protein
VHVADASWIESLSDVTGSAGSLAHELAAAFWPGPLTMVLPAKVLVPDLVRSGLPTVALRCSAHPVMAAVIDELGRPVAAPSANRFGRISPVTAEHVLEELGGRVPLVLDGGWSAFKLLTGRTTTLAASAQPDRLLALAIDHRMQMEKMADDAGAPRERLNTFKRLAIAAIARVSKGEPGFGTLLDDVYGREAMFDAAKLGLWVGRPLEQPGSRPLRFEFTQDVGARLVEWPVTHTIKCLSFYHPDDPAELKEEQSQKLRTLYEAARKVGRELLIEIIAGKHGPLDDTQPQGLRQRHDFDIETKADEGHA